MNRKFFSILALTILFFVSAQPVNADGIPGAVYVDTNYTGSEDGTEAHPYNTLKEGEFFARAQSGGAWIYLKQTDGSWNKSHYIGPTFSGASGIPFANVVTYSALAVLSLILILIGWKFQRQSHQLNR